MNTPDKAIIFASHLCSLSWSAAVKRVDGQWTVDEALLLSWYRKYANAGSRATRLMLYCVGGPMPEGGRGSLLMPWRFVPDADAWDLATPDPEYYTILRRVVELLNSVNLHVLFCPADECQQHGDDRRAQSPLWHNINDVQGVYDGKGFAAQSQHTFRSIAALQGLDYGIEFGNELNGNGARDLLREAILPPVLDAIDAGVLKREDLSLGAFMVPAKYDPKTGKYSTTTEYTNQDFFQIELQQAWVERHGEAAGETIRQFPWRPVHSTGEAMTIPGRPYGEQAHQALDWFADRNSITARVLLSDDGCDTGDNVEGDQDDAGRNRRPSPGWWRSFVVYALERASVRNPGLRVQGQPKLAFEHLPSAIVGGGPDYMANVIRAMSEGYREYVGVWPENYGRFPEPVTPPPPPPVDPPPVVDPPVTPPVEEPAKPVRAVTWHWHWPFLHVNFPLLWRRIWRIE